MRRCADGVDEHRVALFERLELVEGREIPDFEQDSPERLIQARWRVREAHSESLLEPPGKGGAAEMRQDMVHGLVRKQIPEALTPESGAITQRSGPSIVSARRPEAKKSGTIQACRTPPTTSGRCCASPR